MHKILEGKIHASSLCDKRVEYDYEFDRLQMTPEKLYEYVLDAFCSPIVF